MDSPSNNSIQNYLKELFKGMWEAGLDFLENQTMSALANKLRDSSSMVDGLSNPKIDFSKAPSIQVESDKKLTIYIPENSTLNFKSDIDISFLSDPSFNIKAKVDIEVTDDLPSATSHSNVNFSVPFNLLDLLLPWITIPARIATSPVVGNYEDYMAELIRANFLAGAGSYLYDRTVQSDIYRSESFGARGKRVHSWIEGPINLSFKGNKDPKARGYIDILLVADGFEREENRKGVPLVSTQFTDSQTHREALNNGRITERVFDVLKTQTAISIAHIDHVGIWQIDSESWIILDNSRGLSFYLEFGQAIGATGGPIHLNIYDTGDFTKFSHHIGYHFSSHFLEAPFIHFRDSIRIWKLHLVLPASSDPANPSNFAVGQVSKNDTEVRFGDELKKTLGDGYRSEIEVRSSLTFGNLAKVAKIGIFAKNFFGKEPITVFVKGTNRYAYVSTALKQHIFLRYILGGNADVARKVLMHEFGHTLLGRILGDEYLGSSPNRIYLGREPITKNLTTAPFPFQNKWLPWTNELSSNYQTREGAFYHRRGIYTFERDCRMRVTAGPQHLRFCTICRESLTQGMLDFGHRSVGTPSEKGMIYIRVEYRYPFSRIDYIQLDGGTTGSLKIFSSGTTTVQLQVMYSSIPHNWEVEWRVENEFNTVDDRLENRTRNGDSISLFAVSQTKITVKVKHDKFGTIPRLIASNENSPESIAHIQFDDMIDQNLLKPSNLNMNVPFKSKIAQVINEYGEVSLEENIQLLATGNGFDSLDIPTGLEFKVTNLEQQNLEFSKNYAVQPQQERRYRLPIHLREGRYVWSARAYWQPYGSPNPAIVTDWVTSPNCAEGTSAGGFPPITIPTPNTGTIPNIRIDNPKPTLDISTLSEAGRPKAFCFEILPLPFEVKLTAPKNPIIFPVKKVNNPEHYILEAKSWHPNDKRIKFVFQIKKDSENWTDSTIFESETGLLSRDPRDFPSIAIKGYTVATHGQIGYPMVVGETRDWRVKAVDEDGNHESEWIQDRFPIYLSSYRRNPYFRLLG